MPYATALDGTRLFYERFTPPAPVRPLPIVLIAGWATNGRLWRPAVEHGLAAGYETITTDSRGTGRSGVPLRPWSTTTLARDVVAILDHAEVPRAYVAAPSLGGMVAQELGIRHPDRVAALVLAATSGGLPRLDLISLRGLARLMSTMVRPAPPDRAEAVRRRLRLAVSDGFGRTATPEDPAWRAIEAMLDDPVSARGNLYALLAAARHSTWSRLRSLRPPTQIQHGTADQLIRVRAASALAAAIPRAELRLLHGAGHALILERPGETMAAGLSFLDRVSRAASSPPAATAQTRSTAGS